MSIPVLNNVTGAFDGWLMDVVVETPGAVTWDTADATFGQLTEAVTATRTIKAVVQNATPQDMLFLEEGLRAPEAIKLHSKSELRTSEQGNKNADVVLYDNKRWTVHWTARRFIGGYYKAIAVKERV